MATLLHFGVMVNGEVSEGVAPIVTVATDENTSEQVPLFTTALNLVVRVKAPDVNVLLVLLISVQTEPSREDCHFVIVPVYPLKVNMPLVLPEQIVEPPLTVPPTPVGSTVIVAIAEKSSTHTPFFTTALNLVVVFKTFEKVVAVTASSVQLRPPSVEYCHFVTVPL